MSPVWNPSALPDQHGKTIVITGANRGVGFFAAEQLAAAGARVVLACRDETRSAAALAAIRSRVEGATVESLQLDTADLSSVREAGARLADYERIDGLVENAAMVHPPSAREATVDGNEIVIGTNFLGHFALTALAMPALERTEGSRIVPLGSMISRLYDFRIGDLQLRAHYSSWRAYAHSKIAMQVFGFELDRRLRAAHSNSSAIVAHPGFSISGISPRIAGVNEPSAGTRIVDALQSPFAQSKSRGAWPVVRAVADPDAVGGQYYGPRMLTRGRPHAQSPTHTSVDRAIGRELWEKAEEYTGVPFELLPHRSNVA
jgi:NAD(P)-dependent dehydrogenase (short-subunit alcohol dehydrogenase family)